MTLSVQNNNLKETRKRHTSEKNMSVRSEKLEVPGGVSELSSAMQNGLNFGAGTEHVSATISAAQQADSQLGEANAISTSHPDHPLQRTVVASIRATMSDLCLRRGKSVWAPTAEALRSMLQYTEKKHIRIRF